ncbi:hypothetical protein [uncultured Roseobacter sp.]|uniref:hypothetical protein n=1 Tax=uncultured Roseobacter sp. TaxID=114847 RepID=UPI00262E05B9|nr:hypothetical protein [uncultured Roseobacter sp.]
MSSQARAQLPARAETARAGAGGASARAAREGSVLESLQRRADDSAETRKLATLQAQAAGAAGTPPPIQRRQHTESGLKEFLATQEMEGTEDRGEYVRRITTEFKSAYPQHDRADVVLLRSLAWGPKVKGKGMKAYPEAPTKALAGSFDSHVKGEDAGVGWHTEAFHARNGGTYKYRDRGTLGKGAYFASGVKIAGTDKTGNSGRSTFFPATMSLADIRYEAIYVANTFKKQGLVATGRGLKTGIVIDALINGDTVDSAYPHKEGW